MHAMPAPHQRLARARQRGQVRRVDAGQASTQVTPSVEGSSTSHGTPAPPRPAASALAMPVGESSIATQSLDRHAEQLRRGPVRRRVRLRLVHLVAGDHGVEVLPAPIVISATSTSCRRVEVTSAVGTPAARTARSSSSAPGRQTSPAANSSATRSVQPAARPAPRDGRAGPGPRAGSASTGPCWCRPSRAGPRRTARRRGARPVRRAPTAHTFSLSTSVPSMSKSTAAGFFGELRVKLSAVDFEGRNHAAGQDRLQGSSESW